jgi:hypothetical protein
MHQSELTPRLSIRGAASIRAHLRGREILLLDLAVAGALGSTACSLCLALALGRGGRRCGGHFLGVLVNALGEERRVQLALVEQLLERIEPARFEGGGHLRGKQRGREAVFERTRTGMGPACCMRTRRRTVLAIRSRCSFSLASRAASRRFSSSIACSGAKTAAASVSCCSKRGQAPGGSG